MRWTVTVGGRHAAGTLNYTDGSGITRILDCCYTTIGMARLERTAQERNREAVVWMDGKGLQYAERLKGD